MPAQLHSLKLSATYFSVDYRDLVVQPVGNWPTGFSDPIYVPFVAHAPPEAVQTALIEGADRYYNYSGYDYDPTRVVGIIYNDYQNATSQRVNGVDLAYSQAFDWSGGEIDLFAGSTWIRLRQQTIESVPMVELSGTIFNVPDFKAQAGLGWQRRGFSVNGTIRYVADEKDTGQSPAGNIASWTTVDANVSYRFSRQAPLFPALTLGLAVTNLFNRDPPRAISPSISVPGLYFDSTNSSVIGRFISVHLAASW
jgi:hypothetical protein